MKAFNKLLKPLAVISLALGASTAGAAGWPDQTITMVVPYPPGGPTDIVARVAAQGLSEKLGQTVVVDNKAGAGGNIGADHVARAKPDGYTLLVATTAHAINMSLFKDLSYDTRTSFEPVSGLTEGPLVVVTRPDLGVKNIQELIKLAKDAKQPLTFASSGNGQSTHLAAELFNSMAGIKMTHVPYRGSAPAMTDVMGGQVDVMFNTMLSSMPYVKDGKMIALAVTSAKRSPAAPDLPTVAEAGLDGYQATAWNGLLVPKGTPAEVVSKLNAALKDVMSQPEVKEKFSAQGFDANWMSPQDFKIYLDNEVEKWAEVVKVSGATVN
ncbi:Bug family tripartite tricarboxylate transporter substrate binding protein [Pollutimonas harenae]|uniref:Tripartite tricarboxylate transporter substrate binding protein n=1 Tax=Pollutimonas harenae TaxID=657015 RepID=A0A853H2S6_9BURK|nr:tripartite tricarboxylate transporter substrate binding protein [Pollutimonas harenae]NYT86320.1 tripartite tricarboxylate transporter substrate binding protein [Pollutimonas harenae]TEA69922.1 tripartite tricarboxylate transporter substrate binding protein [Pollutimonas harenae]